LDIAIKAPIAAYNPGLSTTQPAVRATEKIQLSASVNGDLNSQAVTWSLIPVDAGNDSPYYSVQGSIDANGVYTAPSQVTLVYGLVGVRAKATSVVDPTRSATYDIRIVPLDVAIKAPITAYVAGFDTTQPAVRATEKIQLSASISSGLNNQAVTWSLVTVSAGNDSPYYSVQGSIDANGVYTAPSQVVVQPSYGIVGVRVKATSVVDPSRSATYDIRIVPLDVAIKAPIAAYVAGFDTTQPAVRATEKIQLSASISSGLNNQAVTWSLIPVDLGNSSPYYSVQGSIDANGVYTAPSQVVVIPAYGIVGVRVKATSVIDSTRSATYDIRIVPLSGYGLIPPVALSSSRTVLTSSEKVQLVASVTTDNTNSGVTWTANAGTISSTGLFTAPVVSNVTSVSVVATSVADPTISATINITVAPNQGGKVVAPIADLAAGDTVRFAKHLSGVNSSGNRSMTLTAPVGTIAQDGMYTAPSATTLLTATPMKLGVSLGAGDTATSSDSQAITVQPIQLSVSSAATAVEPGGKVQVRAQLANDLAGQGVTWTASLGTIDANGVYTAPSTPVSSNTPVTITATSVTNPSRTANVIVNISALEVKLAKPLLGNGATVMGDGFFRFAATTLNANGTGLVFSASKGLMTKNGQFTVPEVTVPTAITITATSVAQPTKTDSETFTLYPDDATQTTATPWRVLDYRYDNDNRRILDYTLALSGRIAEIKYDYDARRVVTEYVEDSTTFDGQIFKMVTLLRRKNQLGGTLTTPGVEQVKNETSLDVKGRLEKTERTVGTEKRVTTFSYASNFNTFTTYNLADNAADQTSALSSDTATIKSYGDQVMTSTESIGVLSRFSSYEYDELGNTILEKQIGAFSGLNTSGSAQMLNRVTRSRYDGFGQMVWTWTGAENGVATSVSANYFFASGELKRKWEGREANQTNYSYDEFGRVSSIQHGERTSDDAVADTAKEKLEFGYDGFGRVVSQKVDSAFNSTIDYDTLNRTIKSTQPNGVVTETKYSISGQPSEVKTTDGSLIVIEKNTDIDAFGNVLTYQYADNSGVASSNYSIETVYDVYNRPIKVTDSRLSAVVSGTTNRSRYMIYDSYGRLTKQLEPVLVDAGDQNTNLPNSTGQWYSDTHRPYSEITYDTLGRKTSERKLLRANSPMTYGSITTDTTSNMPSNANVASSSIEYDGFDRPSKSVDPNNYETTLGYDNSNNAIKHTQEICKAGDTLCAQQSTANSVTTSIRYDAAGKPIEVVDAKAYKQHMGYNIFGKPTFVAKEMNINGAVSSVTTKLMGYTKTGLLEVEAEPDGDSSTPATATSLDANNAAPSGFVIAKKLEYGTRAYPIKHTTQAPNTQTGSSLTNVTTYSDLDYAGRPKTTTLPNTGATAARTERDFDARGNVIRLKDAEGLETKYTFDAQNRLLRELKVARASDAVAFPNGYNGTTGLETTYKYDALGNLSKRTEQGRTVYYAYNSLGKVIAESRPILNSNATLYYKSMAYRLDGQKTFETTYDFVGSHARGSNNPSAFIASSLVNNGMSVTQGMSTWHEYDSRGLEIQKLEIGAFPGLAVKTFSNTLQTFNGLGLRIQRDFTGDDVIQVAGMNIATYNRPLKTDGSRSTSAKTTSYWKYDGAGLLVKSWDRVYGDTTDQNIFEYKYTATGKEAENKRDVQVVMDGNTPPTQDLILGASVATTTNTYNERDQLLSAEVIEKKLEDKRTISNVHSTTRKTTYTYNTDGSRAIENTDGIGMRTFTYDARGRETQVVDSNGAGGLNPNILGATTTTTTYLANGGTSVKMIDAGDNKCKSQTDTTLAVGGLTAKQVVWKWDSGQDNQSGATYQEVICGNETTASVSTSTYNPDGTQSKIESSSPVTKYSITETYEPDAYLRAPNFLTGTHYFRSVYTNKNVITLEYNDYGDVSKQVNTSTTKHTDIDIRHYTGGCDEDNNNSTINCTRTFTWGGLTAEQNDFGYTIPEHDEIPSGAIIPAQTYPAGTAVPLVTGKQFTKSKAVPVPNSPPNIVYPDIWDQSNAYNSVQTIATTTTQMQTNNGDTASETQSTIWVEGGQVQGSNTPNGDGVRLSPPSYLPPPTTGEPDGTKTYTLDAMGRRLKTTGGKYNEFTKRYNPDGQTAEFNRPAANEDGSSGYLNWQVYYNTYVLSFRYDPHGEQVLSADAGVRDFNPHDNTYFLINRQNYATYSSDGEVQMISARGGAVANIRACSVGFIWCWFPYATPQNTWDNPSNNEDDKNNPDKSYARVYDRNFGLADGLKQKTWSVQQPFDIVPETGGQIALETPQTAQSTSLGLNPSSVTAPSATSNPPVNPPSVTPPASSSPVKPQAQAPTPSTNSSNPSTTVSSPSLGTTSTAPAATTTTANPTTQVVAPATGTTTTTPATPTQDPQTAPPEQSQTSSQPITLAAPVNTLPPSVASAVSPTSVLSPESSSNPVAGEDPTQVTAPNQGTPPVTGSSSATSVSAPVGSVPVSNPTTVKPPAGTTTKPTGTISPTSSNEKTITAFLTTVLSKDANGDCHVAWDLGADLGGTPATPDCTPDDLAATRARQEAEANIAEGKPPTPEQIQALRTGAVNQANSSCKNCGQELFDFSNTPLYKSLSPAMQARFWMKSGQAAKEKLMDFEGFQALNRIGAYYTVSMDHGKPSLNFIGGNIGGGAEGINIPPPSDLLKEFMSGFKNLGLDVFNAIAAGFIGAGTAIVSVGSAIGGVMAAGLLAVVLTGDSQQSGVYWNKMQDLRDNQETRLAVLTSQNSGARNPCTTAIAFGIYGILAATTLTVRNNPSIVGLKTINDPTRQNIAAAVWRVNGKPGGKIGVSSQFPVNYPPDSGLAPSINLLDFPPEVRKGWSNVNHAENKIMYQFLNSISVRPVKGEMYMYTEKSPCDISQHDNGGCDAMFQGAATQLGGGTGSFTICVDSGETPLSPKTYK
jgi:YD repeat-containing protein